MSVCDLRSSVLLVAAVVLLGAAGTSGWARADSVMAAEVTPPPAVPEEPARQGALVPIHGEISDVTYESITRRVDLAIQNGAEVIIFEIDTPGGAVVAALDICDYIKNLTSVHTVAWVHTQAISAGSMISMACDEIVMSPASSIGDCGVLIASPLGPQGVPDDLKAKAESPVLTQFRDSANRYGYSKALCEALVISDRTVWWLENTETGQREFVTDALKVARMGEGLDPSTQPADGRPAVWKLVESYVDPVSGRPVEVEQPIVDKDELLTMTQSEAVAYGFAKGLAGGEPDLRARYNLAGTLPSFEFTWSELLVRFLTSMPVRIFLMVIILLGAYVEFHTPGFGIPGLAALVGLAIFVAAPYLSGLATAWELILILLGVVLLVLELFVIPGFGIAGIAGIVLIFAGMLGTFVPAEPGPWRLVPQLPATWVAVRSGMTAIMISLVLSVVAMWYIAKYLPQLPVAGQMILSGEVARGQTLDAGAPTIETVALAVGDRGVTSSVLRPAGKARIRGHQTDVVTEGEMVPSGAEVEVIEVRGNHIVVRELDPGGQRLA